MTKYTNSCYEELYVYLTHLWQTCRQQLQDPKPHGFTELVQRHISETEELLLCCFLEASFRAPLESLDFGSLAGLKCEACSNRNACVEIACLLLDPYLHESPFRETRRGVAVGFVGETAEIRPPPSTRKQWSSSWFQNLETNNPKP